MLFSKSFLPTLREEPKGAECTSHRLSLKGSLLFMVSSGIYAYLPFGFRVLRKIENIIRKRMNETGAQEILMSALQPLEIWKQTGRDKDLEEVMITFKDRRGRQLCLGPTHEEEVTEIVKRYVSSYKQLPFTLYQIQTKFRDEARPRYGLVRSCEFIMKDAYSFDIDDRGLNFSYEVMFNAYKKIFKDCGLEFVTVEADPGAMGGNISHEFMVPADIGEDTLYFCKDCNLYFKKEGKCEKCGRKLKEEKMIEVGHVFKLGTKYSKAQEAYFLDKDGLRKPIVMGCYGIGVSRIISAIIEQNHDKKGIIWPKGVGGFDATLLVLEREDEFLFQEASLIYELLINRGFDILFDDRPEPAGVKFNDAYLIGNPYIIIVGKRYKENSKIELEVRRSGEKLNLNKDELIKFLNDNLKVNG
ncbi:MAG: proline--tRNA ligase [Candidatus Omnitrophica bacterium]|nr:proline--tRNA ligase [Candidatus Omnitrophota bacterium]